MIPKVIHYCWFGPGKLPKLGKRCIASWQKFFPGYEIKEWNEENFDVNMIPYTAEAYKAGKYAFVSDFARFWILYHYGGIYFDTDVEVIKPMDALIEAGAFMGAETSVERGHRLYIASGLGMGCEAGQPFLKECIDLYGNLEFTLSQHIKTVCEYVTDILDERGLQQKDEIQQVCGFTIYPWDYLCPISTEGLVMRKTANTVSIHHYAASWSTPMRRFKKRLARLVGPRLTMMIIRAKRSFKRIVK